MQVAVTRAMRSTAPACSDLLRILLLLQVWRYYLLAVRPETSDSGEPAAPDLPDVPAAPATLLPHQQASANTRNPACPCTPANALVFPLSLLCVPAAFQWDDFAAKNNAELNDNLGNFINRTLKFISARWVGGRVGGGSAQGRGQSPWSWWLVLVRFRLCVCGAVARGSLTARCSLASLRPK